MNAPVAFPSSLIADRRLGGDFSVNPDVVGCPKSFEGNLLPRGGADIEINAGPLLESKIASFRVPPSSSPPSVLRH